MGGLVRLLWKGELLRQSRELVAARRRSLRPKLWNVNRGVCATMWKGSVCPGAVARLAARGTTLHDKVV